VREKNHRRKVKKGMQYTKDFLTEEKIVREGGGRAGQVLVKIFVV
jgi:hypothetical protein